MAMTGFKAYRRKGGDIQAQPITTAMKLGGEDFEPGDYLILEPGKELEGAKKDDFESLFEPVKKNYNKPKAKKAEGAKPEAKAEKAA